LIRTTTTGKVTKTYPSTPLEAAKCDELIVVLNDIEESLFAADELGEEEKNKTRQSILEGSVTRVFTTLQVLLIYLFDWVIIYFLL
jgi:hypothetical protein